jgi:hypothetical protein
MRNTLKISLFILCLVAALPAAATPNINVSGVLGGQAATWFNYLPATNMTPGVTGSGGTLESIDGSESIAFVAGDTVTLTIDPVPAGGNTGNILGTISGSGITAFITFAGPVVIESVRYTALNATVHVGDGKLTDFTINAVTVPEPATLAFVGLGVAAVAVLRRRARQ